MDNYSIFLHNIKSDKNKAGFCYYVDRPLPPPQRRVVVNIFIYCCPCPRPRHTND